MSCNGGLSRGSTGHGINIPIGPLNRAEGRRLAALSGASAVPLTRYGGDPLTTGNASHRRVKPPWRTKGPFAGVASPIERRPTVKYHSEAPVKGSGG